MARVAGAAVKNIPLTLYVHMPWCVRKCPYCDFNSHQLKSARPDSEYINALLRDFEREAPRISGRSIECVFAAGYCAFSDRDSPPRRSVRRGGNHARGQPRNRRARPIPRVRTGRREPGLVGGAEFLRAKLAAFGSDP